MRVEPFRTTFPTEVLPRTITAGPRADAVASPPTRALDVTIDGATRRFESGGFRNALAGTIGKIDMLPASITADGRLQFATNDARELIVLAIAGREAALDVLEGLFSSIEIVD